MVEPIYGAFRILGRRLEFTFTLGGESHEVRRDFRNSVENSEQVESLLKRTVKDISTIPYMANIKAVHEGTDLGDGHDQYNIWNV